MLPLAQFSGLVGDHKNFLDPEFDKLFDVWISQNNPKEEVTFKFDLKLSDRDKSDPISNVSVQE